MRKTKTLAKVPFLAPDVQTKMIPAPTEGWDAISPLATMDPKRAPILDNWVCRPGFVELRGGSQPFNHTLTTSPVESLMVYRSGTTESMFGAAATVIYNVGQGITPGTVAVSGLTNARWQYVNFTPAGGTNVLQCVNGADQLLQFDGSVWTNPVITGLPGGATTANIINIAIQKRRFWYILNNSTIAAFMPVDAIAGPIASYLDLGATWLKGGKLMAMCSWTIDGGSGPQDYATFISSRGQVTIYSGVDPTSATDWKLVGTFDIAPPIGRRCALRVGSDVALITQDGVVPLSQALPFDPSADRSVALTARIQNAMANATNTGLNNFGWQMCMFQAQQLAVLNVPLTENSQQQQYVMNTLTGGWSRFTGWNANCFEIYNDDLYFGDNSGGVSQAYVSASDFTSSISADMQCAFNWLDDPGKTKRMTMVQPLLNIGGSLTPSISVDVDFSTGTQTAPLTTLAGSILWDASTWDVSVWPQLTTTYKNWLSVNALGHALAVRLQANINSGLTVTSLSLFDRGQFDHIAFDTAIPSALPVLQVNVFNSIVEMGGAI
jgi:hypothetical protein